MDKQTMISQKNIGIIAIVSLAVGLTLWINGDKKYESMAEARTACEEWRNNGIELEYYNKYGSKQRRFSRECSLEEETNQILGYEGVFTESDLRKDGKRFRGDDFDSWRPRLLKSKVVKHYRF